MLRWFHHEIHQYKKIYFPSPFSPWSLGCTLFRPEPTVDKALLCQKNFWSSADKKDIDAIENPNHACPRQNIIHLATQHASPQILREFLKNDDININAKNHAGYTALILAARYGRKESLNELLATGADVNRNQ